MEEEIKIYIGPTVMRWGLHHGSTYPYGIPAALRETMRKCPAVRDLVVPVSKCVSARAECARKGSLLHSRYAAVLAGLNSRED